MATVEQIVGSMARAIARREDYWSQPRKGFENVSRKLHNPLNLRWWRDKGFLACEACLSEVTALARHREGANFVSGRAAWQLVDDGYTLRQVPIRVDGPVARCGRHSLPLIPQEGRQFPTMNGYVAFPECERGACKHADHPDEKGWSAGRAQVKINVAKRRLTWLEFFDGRRSQEEGVAYYGFASAKDKNDPVDYARFVVEIVCRELGLESKCGQDGCDCAETARCLNVVIASLAQ